MLAYEVNRLTVMSLPSWKISLIIFAFSTVPSVSQVTEVSSRMGRSGNDLSTLLSWMQDMRLTQTIFLNYQNSVGGIPSFTCLNKCVCVCIYIYITYTYTHLHKLTRTRVYLCLCMHIYLYIYIHTYTYMYIWREIFWIICCIVMIFIFFHFISELKMNDLKI